MDAYAAASVYWGDVDSHHSFAQTDNPRGQDAAMPPSWRVTVHFERPTHSGTARRWNQTLIIEVNELRRGGGRDRDSGEATPILMEDGAARFRHTSHIIGRRATRTQSRSSLPSFCVRVTTIRTEPNDPYLELNRQHRPWSAMSDAPATEGRWVVRQSSGTWRRHASAIGQAKASTSFKAVDTSSKDTGWYHRRSTPPRTDGDGSFGLSAHNP